MVIQTLLYTFAGGCFGLSIGLLLGRLGQEAERRRVRAIIAAYEARISEINRRA